MKTETHSLGLSGVDGAALSDLRKAEPTAKPTILTSRKSTESFSTLGVSWEPTKNAPEIDIEIRTKGDEGWTGWTTLDLDGIAAAPLGGLDPDEVTPELRASTEPLWVGDASGVQVRVDGPASEIPDGLRVDLVDPGESEYDSQVGALPPGSAQAATAQPQIYTRAEWGADETKRCTDPPGNADTLKGGFVHHTATTSDYTAGEVPGIIRGIYAYHVDTNGWCDVGYNFFVDRFGRSFEGRAGGMDQPVIGSHTYGFNTGTVGVAAIGDYDTESTTVPNAVVTAYGEVLGWKFGLHGIDPKGTVTLTYGGSTKTSPDGTKTFTSGQDYSFNAISGHRDGATTGTVCPGDYLYAKLGSIRSAAASYKSLAQPSVYRPVSKPARILDTRTSYNIGTTAGVVKAGTSRTFQVAGRGGVPSTGIGSVLLNVTAVNTPSSSGYLTVYPGGTPRPTSSNVNFEAGRAVANHVQVGVGATGTVTVYASSTTDVIVDVFGYTTTDAAAVDSGQGLFNPTSPYRVLDSRKTTKLAPGETRTLKIGGTGGTGGVPTGASAVVLNLTVTEPTSNGYLTAYPGGQTRPSTSNLNFTKGETRANRVTVPLGSDGTIRIYNPYGSSHVIVDINGWYTSAGSTAGGEKFVGMNPKRLVDTRKTGGALVDQTRTYQVAGNLGVPEAGEPGAPTAVVLNVTAVHEGTSGGYFTLYPADAASRPLASDLNVKGEQVVPNLVVVKLSPDGKFKLSSVIPDATHAVVDVLGYYQA